MRGPSLQSEAGGLLRSPREWRPPGAGWARASTGGAQAGEGQFGRPCAASKALASPFPEPRGYKPGFGFQGFGVRLPVGLRAEILVVATYRRCDPEQVT